MPRYTHQHTHALSPATAKSLVAQFSSRTEPEDASDSSNSPDSLYSNGSPTFHDTAFEFDASREDLHVEERDEDEYESIMGSNEDRQDIEDWREDSWGRWPETGLDSRPGWTPSPKSPGRRQASIISISPRGSPSQKGSLAGSRKTSISGLKLSVGEERRDSNPSLLGFDLAQRSTSNRSLSLSSRRRSSNLSNGSLQDPAEDVRLRNIASMELLRRRFSEAIEVEEQSEDGSEIAYQHTSLARAALMQSPWTPDYDSEDEEDSEIHTAPYIPTPEIPARRMPGLLSNYPLPSAVPESPTLGSPSVYSIQVSPMIRPGPVRMRSYPPIATPPPPPAPAQILRAKTRPAFPRAATDYQFPPRSMGVPAGAGPPRPTLSRATSTPFFSVVQKAQSMAQELESRAAGSFPIARPIPIGVSPLRSTIRRASVISDGGSRRASIIPSSDNRRASADARRLSTASVGSRRGSIVAERQMSIVMGTSVPRKMSAEARRQSNTSKTQSVDSRRSSVSSSFASRKGSLEVRRASKDRRSSTASRKSSVVSIGEYGYLGPQIVIDTATPAIQPSASMPALPVVPTSNVSVPSINRANAPKSIALPAFNANPRSVPNTPSGQPRFNPLEAFFGLAPTETLTPTSGGVPLLTPSSDLFTPRTGLCTPNSDRSSMFETPRPASKNIMDRPRPISPPEFLDSFPVYPRSRQLSPRSTKASPSFSSTDTHVAGISSPLVPSSTDTHVEDELPPSPKHITSRMGVQRKAVPRLTTEELKEIEQGEISYLEGPENLTRNYLRRGALELFTPGDSAMPRPGLAHRRTESTQSVLTPRRLPPRRQNTLPPDLDSEALVARPSPRRDPRYEYYHEPSHTPPHSQQSPQRSQERATPPRHTKQPSVTFSPEVKESRQSPSFPSRPTIQRAASSSSFSRFFHTRSKSGANPAAMVISSPVSTPSSAERSKGGLKSSLRPVSMEGYSSSSGSDRTLVEVKDMLRKAGQGSPRSPRGLKDGTAYVKA